jgi:GT2 family glycosyltransferase
VQLPLDDADDIDAPMTARVTVVIATRNRRAALTHTLARLAEPHPAPPGIVDDNGSDDHSVQVVGERFPTVRVLAMGHNLGAAARNLGVQAAVTPYVAFCDDDSWWAPGALERAAAILDRHRRLALVAARTLVGPQERTDPVTQMAASPLPTAPGAPGPSVLGFLACAAVLRRDAFLQVGGFRPLLFVFGEETLLAYDLAAAGWQLCYVADVVAHHHPSPSRADPRRRTALAGLLARLPAALAQRPRCRPPSNGRSSCWRLRRRLTPSPWTRSAIP